MAVIVVVDIVVMVWGVEESLHDDVEALAAGGVAGVAVAAEALTAAAHARHTQHGLHPKQQLQVTSVYLIYASTLFVNFSLTPSLHSQVCLSVTLVASVHAYKILYLICM